MSDVIFDLDGTLINSSDSILWVLEEVLNCSGLSPAARLGPHLVGPSLKDIITRVCGPNNFHLVDDLILKFKDLYDSIGWRKTLVFDGVYSMLEGLQSDGYRLHIATNKRVRPTSLILNHYFKKNLFSSVYCLDLGAKPYASKACMISDLLLTQKLGYLEAVYIGDLEDDRVAAISNKLAFIFASWSHEPSTSTAFYGTLGARHPCQIQGLISELTCENMR